MVVYFPGPGLGRWAPLRTGRSRDVVFEKIEVSSEVASSSSTSTKKKWSMFLPHK